MSSVNIVGVEPRLSLLEDEVDEIEAGGGGGDDKAVPITVTNASYTSTINNGGNSVTMNIEDALFRYANFEIIPGHIILDAPNVDFPFFNEGQSAYFRLKFDSQFSHSFVYSIFPPPSGPEIELISITPEGGITLNELTLRGTGTTVTSCLREPNWFLPLNVPGSVDITQKLGMTPVSITVDGPLKFTMKFDDSVRETPFARETTDFDKVRMTVYVQWTDGNYQLIDWNIGTNKGFVKHQVYTLTDEPLPSIQIELDANNTLSTVEDLTITCSGLVPVYAF
jgi:hypothetical protein